MHEYYSKALVKKNRILRIYESLISLLSKVLSYLSDYYSYKGFVHDSNFRSNNIFSSSSPKWVLNKTFNNKLFRNDDYEYIISKTNYFGAIENVSEYDSKWFEDSNDICMDLNKTVISYDEEDNDIKVTKESQPLASIPFSYQPNGSGCNPWIYDIFIYAGFSSLGETFKTNEIPTASQDINLFIKEKIGISTTPYFSEDEIHILKSLEVEEEYIDSNFKHYDDDTRAEILDKSERLYNNGLEKIKTMNKPAISFTADIANLFMLDAFKGVIKQNLFALGNKINVTLRNDYVIQVTIKEIHVDFNEPENNFSFTCDNANTLIYRENSNIFRKLGASYRKTKASK